MGQCPVLKELDRSFEDPITWQESLNKPQSSSKAAFVITYLATPIILEPSGIVNKSVLPFSISSVIILPQATDSVS